MSVVAKTNPASVRVLVAYVAPGDVVEPSLQDVLLAHAAAFLPPYMVPSVILPVPALPRNASNKVDVAALPEPDWSEHVGHGPRSLMSAKEQRAAAVWCDVLGLESFDPDANFFYLGGDSVALSSCIARLEKDFGRRVSPGEFFTRSFRQILATLESE